MANLDEEQHYDRLDMDADYEGGEFINGEFFHRGKKQRKAQTAEDALYGVFAEDSGAPPPPPPTPRPCPCCLPNVADDMEWCAIHASNSSCSSSRVCALNLCQQHSLAHPPRPIPTCAPCACVRARLTWRRRRVRAAAGGWAQGRRRR